MQDSYQSSSPGARSKLGSSTVEVTLSEDIGVLVLTHELRNRVLYGVSEDVRELQESRQLTLAMSLNTEF
jgi:hypothetical protein